jgi:hypothetical protein
MTLLLKRAKFSRPSGHWSDEDYDVLADGKVVGRIYEQGGVGEAARAAMVLVDHDRAGGAQHDQWTRRDGAALASAVGAVLMAIVEVLLGRW